jgi:hypothetical protein
MLIGSVSNVSADVSRAGNQPLSFDLSAAAAGFAPDGDGLLFVCKTNTGGDFQGILKEVDPASVPTTGCGVMIRESSKPDSPFLFVGASRHAVFACRRSEYRQLTNTDLTPVGAPGSLLFLKLAKIDGIHFVPSYSLDGRIWSAPVEDFGFSGNDRMLVGFAIYSGTVSNTGTARFLDMPSPADRTAKN